MRIRSLATCVVLVLAGLLVPSALHPRAVDVQDGWGLVTTEAAFEALGHSYGILEQAMRHTTTARDRKDPPQ